MHDLKFGVIGFGGAGRPHVRRLDSIDGVKVTQVYDPKISTIDADREKQYQDITFTDNLTDFLASDIDAVTICSPDHTHFAYAKQTIERGTHTLVEKPMFTTLSECEQMADLLKSSKVVFGVHHQKRFIPSFAAARKCVVQGRLGDIVAIEVDYIHYMKYRAIKFDTWRLDPINPQNIVLGAMSHSFDLINWIVGEQPQTVYSISGHKGWKDYPDIDTNITVLQYKSGMVAKASSTIASAGPQKERLAIYGNKGQIHNNLFIDSAGKSHLIIEPKYTLGRKQRMVSLFLKYTNMLEFPYSINEHDRACLDLLSEFVRCIRTKSAFSVDFYSSQKAIEICLSAIESYRTGKVINFGQSESLR